MTPATTKRRLLPTLLLTAAAALAAATAASAAAPVRGSVAGPVVSVGAKTFSITTTLSPTGKSAVHLGSTTVITEMAAGTTGDLKTGTCATALGQKSAKGVITAMRISLSQAVKGSCANGFGRPGGRRPPGAGSGTGSRSGGQRPTPPPGGASRNGFANFGFAAGAITSVKGSTVTLHGTQGTSTVQLTSATQISKTERVQASAVKLKLCAFVFGTSADKGVSVTAQSVSLSQPRNGSCTSGFRRP